MSSVNVKAATTAALKYFKDVYAPNLPDNIRIEEVWLSDDEENWHITLGYDLPASSQALAILQPPVREYKEFVVRASDGRVVAMRIRKP